MKEKHPGIYYSYNGHDDIFPVSWHFNYMDKGFDTEFFSHIKMLFFNTWSLRWDHEKLMNYMLQHLRHQDSEFLL